MKREFVIKLECPWGHTWNASFWQYYDADPQPLEVKEQGGAICTQCGEEGRAWRSRRDIPETEVETVITTAWGPEGLVNVKMTHVPTGIVASVTNPSWIVAREQAIDTIRRLAA